MGGGRGGGAFRLVSMRPQLTEDVVLAYCVHDYSTGREGL